MNDLDIAHKYVNKYNNAKQRGVEFTLTLADMKRLMNRKTCYYTKQKLTDSGKRGRTIDRINSKLGYVKGNVVACTVEANSLKNTLLEQSGISLTVVKRMIKNIEEGM